jgi:hypothetical protein
VAAKQRKKLHKKLLAQFYFLNGHWSIYTMPKDKLGSSAYFSICKKEIIIAEENSDKLACLIHELAEASLTNLNLRGDTVEGYLFAFDHIHFSMVSDDITMGLQQLVRNNEIMSWFEL